MYMDMYILIGYIRKVVKEKGLLRLYHGLPAPLFGSCVENLIMFWLYGMSERKLEQWNVATYGEDKGDLSMWQVGLSGAFSGIGVGLWLTPVELIKCRMQIQNDLNIQSKAGASTSTSQHIYRNTWHCLKHVLTTNPFQLFHGLVPTLYREIPGTAIFFVSYQSSLNWLNSFIVDDGNNDNNNNNKRVKGRELMNSLISGGVAGIAFWSTIYPFDTIKTQQQLHPHLSSQSMFSLMRLRWTTHGLVKGLYPGFGITIPRAILSNSILFFAHRYSKDLLTQIETRHYLIKDNCKKKKKRTPLFFLLFNQQILKSHL
ncbi:hypothetical protein RFI_14450 [Reticulomyxa filosa]|uniref:Mitochondrial carrier protein n=1 Tax=Reticulomyxa filosa TaxID=46433 RepID=X6N8X3_RETFI|nr:hypothetical protein RFI_14450 [Reticulomyxa filosa]|eukprot:ETO22745.1 hypothetical protein RFI_14450 [Reticulomyxa filosa]